jgi:hypothetical protein
MTSADIKKTADEVNKVHRETVIWENNLASIQTKVTDLIRQKELLQKEVDAKSVAFNASMAEERLRMEREHGFVAEERKKLEAGKLELVAKIEEARIERNAAEKAKADSEAMLAKAKYLRTNVDQFIIAVQRALTILG